MRNLIHFHVAVHSLSLGSFDDDQWSQSGAFHYFAKSFSPLTFSFSETEVVAGGAEVPSTPAARAPTANSTTT